MHVVTGRPERVGVGSHRGEKQHDFLLVMPNIGAQSEVFSHENTRLGRRGQMLEGKQLVTENDEQYFRLHDTRHYELAAEENNRGHSQIQAAARSASKLRAANSQLMRFARNASL